MNAGDEFAVSARPGEPIAINTYIYDSRDALVFMDDEDGPPVPSFRWRASVPGEYYVEVRNTTNNRGTVVVSIGRSMGPSPSPQDYDGASIRLFFATNRRFRTASTPSDQFGPDPAPDSQLTYGIFRVGVPRNAKIGVAEGPVISRLFQGAKSQSYVLDNIENHQQARFSPAVSDRVRVSSERQLLLFVHGYRNTFEQASIRLAQIAYDLRIDGAIILFSWPSQGQLLGYTRDLNNAEISVRVLRDFLSKLLAESGATKIHLLAHSMGSFVLGRALELMGEQTASGTPAFANVIFLAPDVDADRFRQMAPLIKKMARRVTLYASSRDLAMEAAQFVHGRRRAGGVDGDLLVAPNVFDTVDATYAEPRKLGPEHDYFATSPTVLADLFHLIRGEPPEQRFRLDPRQAKGGRYWFIREGAQ